jgi:hypothetical protein
MKKYIVALKNLTEDEIIIKTLVNENSIYEALFDTKEEAEEEKERKNAKYIGSFCVCELNISVEKLL